jgi:tetratricopeptide (TPR) repeat protein
MLKNKTIIIIFLIVVSSLNKTFSQELKIDPMYRIQLLVQMEKYESAIEFTEKLDDSLKCEKFEILAFSHSNLNNHPKSIYYYEKYIAECNPSYVQRVNLGDSYYKTSQFEKAKEQFLIVKKEMPDLALIDYNLGLIEYDNGNKEKAVEYYTSAINKTKGETLDFDYVEIQISTLNELSKYDTAIKNIDTILGVFDNNSIEYKYSQIIKSSIFGAKGEYKKAIKMLDGIIESKIDNETVLIEAYSYQLNFYSKMGKKNKTCEIYKKIANINPESNILQEYKCK